MQTSIQPISGEWKKMFKAPATELTEYAKEHPLVLKNKRIEDEDISESQFYGANFKNVEWNDVVAQEGLFDGAVFDGGVIYDTSFALSTLRNVKFDNVKFGEASFSKGVLENVLFNNCMIDSSSFVAAKLQNVAFKNCKIYKSEIRNLRSSKVRIEDSEISDTNFFMSTLDIEIINSKGIEALNFLALEPGSSVKIKNSSLGEYTDFSESNLELLSIESSRLVGNVAAGVKARKVVVKDSDIGIDLGEGTYGVVTYERSKDVVMDESTIGAVSIQDCTPGSYIDFGKSKAKTIVIRNCHAKDIILNELVADEVILTGVQADNFIMPQARIGKLTLQNVSFKNNLDLTGAVAKDIVKHAIEIAPATVIKTEGTNIHLTGKPETD